jgi:hypothetical protein
MGSPLGPERFDMYGYASCVSHRLIPDSWGLGLFVV